jgi:hypothetical protein
MKRLALLLIATMIASGCFAHNFKLINDEIIWEKSFKGTPNKSAIINTIITDSTIIGQLNNYTVDYEAQDIEWRYLPLMLNDPLSASVIITIYTDSTYNVVVKDLTFRISDRQRGLIGQLTDLEYNMIHKGKLTKDPELVDILDILSKDFERLF